MPSKDQLATYPLQTQAGIKRDGTSLDGNYYSDGLWCRFRNGRPMKMRGYRDIANISAATLAAHVPTGPVRGVYPIMKSPQAMIHCGHANGVAVVAADQSGVGGGVYDRTPAGFTAGDIYSWSLGALWDATGGQQRIFMHAAPDLLDITSDAAAAIYYGTGTDTASVLTTPAGSPSVSGGICVIPPFVFAFGSNGIIANCDVNKPTTWAGGYANTANVASTKVCAGMPLRGGANAPAGLFWSLAELIRVSFVGGTQNWRYDTLSDQSSLLSSSAVIEYDGVYYWPGIDRFLMYNGVLKELPNPLNQDFFFDNLNFAYRNKVWGMRIARWGEIWWFFPKGSSTECNWAVIFNVRENTWYDTPINRSAGFAARELPITIMADASSNTDGSGNVGFRLFQHEFGVDSVIGSAQVAIQSNFETSDLGFASGGPSGQGAENANVQTRITRIEQDFRQVGDMTVTVRGSSYAQDNASVDSDPVTFSASGASPQVVDVREQRRLLRLKFESNVLGGNYHAGKVILHLEPGDKRG